MSLFSTLGSTVSAMNAQTQAINVTGNNIANLNNSDYANETVSFNDLGSVQTPEGPESMGLDVTVQQDRNTVLDAMVRQEASLTSGFQSQQSLLNEAQASLGENITSSSTASTSGSTSTVSDSGLSAAIDDFFNAVQNYATDPADAGQAQALVQQAGILTDRFNEVDTNLGQVQSNATEIIDDGVSNANNLLTQIAQLNSQISSLEVNSPGSAVDLRDQREGALEQLAALVPITATEDSTGQDTVTTTDASNLPISLVSQGTVKNTLAFNGTALTTAGGAADPLGVTSGSLQGTITASVGPVQTLRATLDAVAQQIVTSVNSAYNPSNSATGNFFNSAGTTAGTIAVDPNLTASTLKAGPSGAGDNSIALAVAAVANQSFSTGSGDAITGTISQAYANGVSAIGQALDTANTQVTDQTNVQTIVNNQRQAVSGVSLDQEMSNLVTYQKAYQASSEVFQVIDDMINTLVSVMSQVA
jgi:flagellar hook-associated protein 1 FlgK